ncbi:hypothetical protein H2O64_14420 [Kordia sp. YSTF-M3]|uniref:DUF481 domain-containing protein n=1 Tax=Kordia aestuariivivens TaxID=2759037 RepID=A0ABR7QC11_9FLAO|nr:hypothetical protein [Kordia aestuariivivens]MBC8755869.1 hypothetical protein [Kordia aestuariivivens]
MKKNIILSLCIAMLSISYIFSQQREDVIKNLSDDDSYILADVSYINDAVFMGRRDSIAAPYIFPSIGYYDASGFFADATVSYLTASEEQRVDLFLLSGGYLFNSKKWSGGILATGYFYNDDSYAVQSEMAVSINGLLSYDLDYVELSASIGSFFNSGSTNDFFTSFFIEKSFINEKETLVFKPSIGINAGTQNFYEAYYQSNRLGNRKGQGAGNSAQLASNTVTFEKSSSFNILNIELSTPIEYHYKSFIFSFTPSLALPQSSATIVTEDTVFEEDLDSVFYWTVGVSYWFKTKKKQQ